jgi:hypothetical protein
MKADRTFDTGNTVLHTMYHWVSKTPFRKFTIEILALMPLRKRFVCMRQSHVTDI